MGSPWGDSGQWPPRSLTGSVLNHNHTVAARCPQTRWARHRPEHNTNIASFPSLYTDVQGASSGAQAVWVYFWMYSLHSERVAVGARQLWRQRVIVARQPDRPKMAELTGTGERARFTLALASLWQAGVVSPTDTPCDCSPRWKAPYTATVCWWIFTRRATESRSGQGGR